MENYEMRAVLAGNPGVGKTTIFRGLTGTKEHIGKWAGATADAVWGKFTYNRKTCLLGDLPGMYSVGSRSAKEETARQHLCGEETDAVVVVGDAACLERGLHLLKEILSLERVRDRGIPLILCVNRCDQAERKGIRIDFELLRDVLQFPVVPCRAGNREELAGLKETILECSGVRACYECLDFSPKQLARETVCSAGDDYARRQEVLDRILTGRFTGSLLTVVLLMAVFWLTIAGAGCPSLLLWKWFTSLEGKLMAWLAAVHVPEVPARAAVFGAWRAAAWVTAVMGPPLAIFFPLYTMLEDSGCLPRMAFCADRSLKRCGACGRQCLTMAMGLGCSVAGVTGCRDIDSPRERLTAILTNSLIPCSGRFPALFMLITLFLIPGFQRDTKGNLMAALFLTAVMVTGVVAALGCSWLLSCTVLKEIPSVFTLELPPCRRPQLGKILVRSFLNRAPFVLARAVSAAAFAGLVIWLLANRFVGGHSLLDHLTVFFAPAGRLMGLDGAILTAFFLGFPADEVVVPAILMIYLQSGSLADVTDPAVLQTILVNNGWTWKTALCMVIFCLFHWPCLAVCRAVKKETGSLRWTVLAAAIPALLGVVLCTAVNRIINF